MTASTAFAAALAALDQAVADVSAAAGHLPVPDADRPCCETPDLRVISFAEQQWCKVDPLVPGRPVHAYTSGWADMGDMDGPSFVQCIVCRAHFRTPDTLEWN